MQLHVQFTLAAMTDDDLKGVLARLFNALAACPHDGMHKTQLTDAVKRIRLELGRRTRPAPS